MIKKLLPFALLLLLAASCQNNGYLGDLFGRWQLTSLETATETTTYDSIYYSFQGIIFEARRINADYVNTVNFGEFTHHADSINVRLYSTKAERIKATYKLTDTIDCFTVLELNHRRMVLRSRQSDQIYTFIKY